MDMSNYTKHKEYQRFLAHISREPTREDMDKLGATLRWEDRREVITHRGYEPADWGDMLWEGVCDSKYSLVAYEDARKQLPMLVLGAEEFAPTAAVVWMLGTPAIDASRWTFLRLCKYALIELQERWENLLCFPDSRNFFHIRWLKHLGFECVDHMPENPRFLVYGKGPYLGDLREALHNV